MALRVAVPPGGRAAVLLLADSRFPAGGHAHSAGMEEAVGGGLVRDLTDVAEWAADVLWTAGLTAAGLAAWSCRLAGPGGEASERSWAVVDAEADARTPSPAQRQTSRRLGRQLLRTACRVWAADVLVQLGHRWPDGPHRPVVAGAVTAAAGGTPLDASLGEAYGSVAVPVGAAVRLLGLDPVAGAAVVADLAPAMEQVAGRAVAALAGPVDRLPACSAPMVDLCAEAHARRRGTLFAS